MSKTASIPHPTIYDIALDKERLVTQADIKRFVELAELNGEFVRLRACYIFGDAARRKTIMEAVRALYKKFRD